MKPGSFYTNSMKKLEKTFVKKGFKYTQVERKGEFAIYKDVTNKTVNDLRREGLGTAINRLPSRLGNAFIGEDGRPVEITMRRGGRVKEERVRGYGIAQKGHGRGRFVR